MIKLVAFDLDGTIGDTLPMCIQAFKEATQPSAGRELSDEEVVQTFGLNEEGMIRCVVDEAYQQQALHDFYVIYETLHKTMCPKPFEGIRELITLLKQKGMESCFAKVVIGNAERNVKAEALEELLHTYHLSADEIVYIGDTVSDIKECQKANVKCLSAAWSISQSETLESHNAKNVFYSISSISGFLLSRIREIFD